MTRTRLAIRRGRLAGLMIWRSWRPPPAERAARLAADRENERLDPERRLAAESYYWTIARQSLASQAPTEPDARPDRGQS